MRVRDFLTQRETGATVGGTASTYSYDGDDTRVGKTVGGNATNYVWDREDGLPLLVDDGTNAYLHEDGALTQINGAGTPEYLLGDALGSRRGVTNLAGTLTGTADYDTFGAVRASAGVGSVFGYTGEQFDAETGYTYLRARYLNPALGRFTSADTVQPNAPGTQGYNLYAYVANNPMTWVDPSGHETSLAAAYSAWIGIPAVFAMVTACEIYVEGCAAAVAGTTTLVLAENRYGLIPWGVVGMLALVCALSTEVETTGSGVRVHNPCLDLAMDMIEKTANDAWEKWEPQDSPEKPPVPVCPPGTSCDDLTPDPCMRLGKWIPDRAYMSVRSRLYQGQVTGRPDEAFLVGPTKFDGCRAEGTIGVLLEAKACRYAYFLENGLFNVGRNLVGQAFRQVTAARAKGGAPIEWHFAEEKAAKIATGLLRGFPDITVMYDAPRGFSCR